MLVVNQKMKENRRVGWSPKRVGRIRIMELPLGLLSWMILNQVIHWLLSLVILGITIWVFEWKIVEPNVSEEQQKEEELYRQLVDTLPDEYIGVY